MMALAETDGRSKEEIEEEENKSKALVAAKAGNLAVRLVATAAAVESAVEVAAAEAAAITLRAIRAGCKATASTSTELCSRSMSSKRTL